MKILRSERKDSESISFPSGPINLPAPVSAKPHILMINFLWLPVGANESTNKPLDHTWIVVSAVTADH